MATVYSLPEDLTFKDFNSCFPLILKDAWESCTLALPRPCAFQNIPSSATCVETVVNSPVNFNATTSMSAQIHNNGWMIETLSQACPFADTVYSR